MQYITQNDQCLKLIKSQLASIQALLSQRASNTLPSQTEANPKNEEVKVVSTSSGWSMTEIKKKKKSLPPPKKGSY